VEGAGASTDDEGAFGMFLEPGQYRMRVEPGTSVRSKATSTYFPAGDDTYFTVGASGTSNFSIVLGEPNMSGTVTLPSGDPAENSWVYAMKWSDSRGWYEWSADVGGANSSSDGD